jgi:molybdenum cofactor biosynthesis enzyme MoaA
MPFEKAKENISKAIKEFDVKEAVILGGEPTLYKDLFPLVNFLKGSGLRRVGLTTNGIRLKETDFLIELIHTGIDFINISYHNDDFITFDDLFNIYKTFGCEKYSWQKIRINTNVWKGNHDNLQSLDNFIDQISLCCDEIRVSNIIHKDSFSVNPNNIEEAEKMYMTDEEYEVLFNKFISYKSKDYTIIYNPEALGFVQYYLIPAKVPIIVNWNIDSKVSEQVCENDLQKKKIHTVKCLVSGDISLSWNTNNIIFVKN